MKLASKVTEVAGRTVRSEDAVDINNRKDAGTATTGSGVIGNRGGSRQLKRYASLFAVRRCKRWRRTVWTVVSSAASMALASAASTPFAAVR